MQRRQSVDLAKGQYKIALSQLPLKKGSHKGIVNYTDLNFKHAPKWEKASPYRKCIDMLVVYGNGKNVNQKSFMEAAVEYNRDELLEVPDEDLEMSVYALRAIISQMLNHKQKSRSIPKAWVKHWSYIVEKLDVSGDDVDDDDDDDDDDEDDAEGDDDCICLGDAQRPLCARVDLTDEDIRSKVGQVLNGVDDEFTRLLNSEFNSDANAIPSKQNTSTSSASGSARALVEPQVGSRRPKTSSAKQAMAPTSASGPKLDLSKIKALVGPQKVVVNQKAFAAVNKNIKAGLVKPNKRITGKQQVDAKKKPKSKKTMKAMKATKAMKAMKTPKGAKIDFKTYKKNMHSVAWHREYDRQTKVLGREPEEAKKAAKKVAKTVTDRLDQEKADNCLPNHVALDVN